MRRARRLGRTIHGPIREPKAALRSLCYLEGSLKEAEADIEDMFDAEFYVGLVNAEFASQLGGEIDVKALKSKEPRILQRLEKYFAEHPLKDGIFSHYRPARCFSENSKKLSSTLPEETKDRFEAAFKAVNALIT